MKKSFAAFTALVISIFIVMGCSGEATQGAKTSASGMRTPAPTAASSALQAADAARTVADADDSGAPYFVAYEYDAANYLVSAYQNRQGPGNYTGGGEFYLVDKKTGAITANSEADVSRVDFGKYLAVYSKLSGEIIE